MPGQRGVEPLQLQRQTFTQVARGDAAWLQTLNDAQRGLELFGGHVHVVGEHLVERLAQIAILIDCFDDEIGEHIITLRQPQ